MNRERLTFLESFPLTVAGIGVGVRHRTALTGSALRRGRELAAAAKPLMDEQSKLVCELADIQGQARCSALLHEIDGNTAALRQSVVQQRTKYTEAS